MPGLFDDLVPQSQASAGLFDDLVPKQDYGQEYDPFTGDPASGNNYTATADQWQAGSNSSFSAPGSGSAGGTSGGF